MPPAKPKSALLGLYQAFANLSRDWPRACTAGCATCCSDQVQLTTLEGELVLERLRELERWELRERLRDQASAPAAPRLVSMNELARLALQGQDAPAEPEGLVRSASCPLLEEGLCLVYEARPLACRAMFSQEVCLPDGAALQDPWLVSLCTAFFQLVEHLDAGGGFGNLRQVLAAGQSDGGHGLFPCQALPGILAPPEHQQRLDQALSRVMSFPVEGRSLGWWLAHART